MTVEVVFMQRDKTPFTVTSFVVYDVVASNHAQRQEFCNGDGVLKCKYTSDAALRVG